MTSVPPIESDNGVRLAVAMVLAMFVATPVVIGATNGDWRGALVVLGGLAISCGVAALRAGRWFPQPSHRAPSQAEQRLIVRVIVVSLMLGILGLATSSTWAEVGALTVALFVGGFGSWVLLR